MLKEQESALSQPAKLCLPVLTYPDPPSPGRAGEHIKLTSQLPFLPYPNLPYPVQIPG